MDVYLGALIELTPMLLLALGGTALLVRGGWISASVGLLLTLVEAAALYGMAHSAIPSLLLYFLASVTGTALGLLVGLPLRRRRITKRTLAA